MSNLGKVIVTSNAITAGCATLVAVGEQTAIVALLAGAICLLALSGIFGQLTIANLEQR